MAEESGETAGGGYVRGRVSVSTLAGTGCDCKSIEPEPSRADRNYRDVWPESGAARGVINKIF